MSIYATLHTHPTCQHTHEVIYITRGASAELVYPLYDKVFRFEDIEQGTFIFKQGKKVKEFTFEVVNTETKPVLKEDSHFYYFDNKDYDAIILNLDSEETKFFKAGLPIEYEIAIKLDTDSFVTLGKQDSIIIEPQHPIEVRDSLYSHLEEN
jgi:hypothetical protein